MCNAFDTNATRLAIIMQAFMLLLYKLIILLRIMNISSRAGSINCCLEPSFLIYKVQEVQY